MNQELHLNPDTIRHANSASHFDAGDSLAREAQRVYMGGLSTFEEQEDWTDAQRAYAEERAESWRALVEKAYNDMIHRRASWVPVSVAGPSNYNSSRNSKRADAAVKAGAEWHAKLDRFLENTEKRLKVMVPDDEQIQRYRDGRCSDPISADDPAAAFKLAARIERLKDVQTHMKALNAHHRKHKTCKGFTGIPDEQAAALDEAISKACSWDKRPYPVFELTNNNANIKRLEERLQQLTKARARAEATAEDAEKSFVGLRVVEDTDANRIRLYFDEKPNDAARALVEALGLTQQEPPAPEATEPETITLEEFVRRAASLPQ